MDINIVTFASVIMIIAFCSERIVEILKGIIPFSKIKDDKLRGFCYNGLSIGFSFLIAMMIEPNLCGSLPIFIHGTSGMFIVALLAGSGSTVIYNFMSLLINWKNGKSK